MRQTATFEKEEKKMSESEEGRRASDLRRVEYLSQSAGVPLDMSKTRFVINRESMAKLILTIQENEFKRGTNEQICVRCRNKLQAHLFRPFSEPGKTWDFCKNCPCKEIIRK